MIMQEYDIFVAILKNEKRIIPVPQGSVLLGIMYFLQKVKTGSRLIAKFYFR